MKRLLLAALLAAGPASADMVAKNGADTLRLTDVECPVTMMKHLPAEIIGTFRAAVAIVDGQTHFGCWTLRSDAQVFLRYEDGDVGVIPVAHFKHEAGI